MRKWMAPKALGAGVALAALLGASSVWAQNDANAANGAQQPASGAQMPATRQIQMVPATAELQKGLNAKKLKPGQPVTARLEQNVTLPNEPTLKRNTVLEGHVVAVQASQHHSNSKVTLTFTQAKLKNGTMLPVKVTVMRLSAPAAMAQAEAETGGPMAAGAAPSSAPASAAGGPGGSPGMPSAQPAPMNTPEPGTVGATSNNSGSGVPGVMLKSDIHQATSATFTSKGRNVEVPGGTQMQIAIAYLPKGVQVH